MVLTGGEFVEKKFFYKHEMSVILDFAGEFPKFGTCKLPSRLNDEDIEGQGLNIRSSLKMHPKYYFLTIILYSNDAYETS